MNSREWDLDRKCSLPCKDWLEYRFRILDKFQFYERLLNSLKRLISIKTDRFSRKVFCLLGLWGLTSDQRQNQSERRSIWLSCWEANFVLRADEELVAAVTGIFSAIWWPWTWLGNLHSQSQPFEGGWARFIWAQKGISASQVSIASWLQIWCMRKVISLSRINQREHIGDEIETMTQIRANQTTNFEDGCKGQALSGILCKFSASVWRLI